MWKSCLLFVLFNVYTQLNLVYSNEAKYGKNEIKKEIKKLEKIEAKLDQLKSLLKDPLDEEHDTLEIESDDTHAHEWTVQLKSDDYNDALKIAKRYGFDHVHKLSLGDGVYRFAHVKKQMKKEVKTKGKDEESKVEKTVDKRDHIESLRLLANDENVRWLKRERILQREKRVPLRDALREAKHVEEQSADIIPDDPQFHNQWYIRNVGQTTGPSNYDSNIAVSYTHLTLPTILLV